MIELFEAMVRALRRHTGGARNTSLSGAASDPRFAALQKQLDLVQESEQSLRITLMSMGDGVIATDSEARITFLNPSAQELTGWTLEQALGTPFREVFRIYNSITSQPAEDIVQTVLTTGRKVNLANHTVLTSLDGTHRHISDSAAPIRDAQGNTAGVVLIFSDITERYHLQQQLRISEARSTAAVTMARLGTWEYDARSNTVIWSPVFKQIVGAPQEFAPEIGFWNTLVHSDDLKGNAESRDAAMAHGNHYEYQYRIHRMDDGVLRYVKTYANIERDETGAIRKIIGVLQDVTEELEIGERIRESEELYRSAFEQAVIGMAHIGLDGRFLRVNRSLCNILKYTAEELLSRSAQELVHQEDAKLLSETMDQLFREHGTTAEALRRFYRSDGSVAWLSISSSVMLNSEGKPHYLISSIQDITIRQQAQTALLQSEQRLRRAQEVSHTGNWEINLSTMQMWASDEAFRIYGYEQTQDNVLPAAIPQSAVLPEQRAMMDQALDRLLRDNAPYDIEFSIRRFGGSRRFVHSMAVAERDADGRPLRVIGVMQDVTDKRRIEEEYGKALATTPDGFWMCDNRTRVVLVNDAICSMMGYTRQELIGTPIVELEARADAEEVRARRQRMLTAGAERFETQMRRKDGSIFDVEVCLSYIPSSEAVCAFICAILRSASAGRSISAI